MLSVVHVLPSLRAGRRFHVCVCQDNVHKIAEMINGHCAEGSVGRLCSLCH